MRFRILGPLEVWDGGHPPTRVSVGGPQQRALLAVLLLNANRVVSADRLVESLWAAQPPPAARGLLQGCVAQLRRALRGDRQPLLTRTPGYLFEVAAGELDVDRFTELAARAGSVAAQGSQAELERAASLLGEALSLWRGPALDGIELDSCRAEAALLEERRLTVLEERIDVELRLGHGAALTGELQALVREHPLRERLWAQLVLALHGADRQAEALVAYRQVRDALVEQLGVEPGATLQRLHGAILAGHEVFDVYRRERGWPPAMPVRQPSRQTVQQPAQQPPRHAVQRPARPPAQLPADTAAFTGRDRSLKRLDELLVLDDTAVIGVISGTAGVGKTALALRWAHRVRERFADGQLYVNLRGYTRAPPVRPLEALAGCLLALGVPTEQIPVEVDQAAAMFRTLLADRRLLVVLDDARSADQVRPLLPGGPGCLVLVTSRDRLAGLVARDGAAHIGLDVFTPDEAVLLIARVLGSQRAHAEPSATAELVRLCASLPLALRIAAANLALQPHRTIADYVGELATGNRLGALAVEGDEHSAVRAAFDLSYIAMAPDTRRLFRLLGLVAGPDVTAEAAAALVETAPERAAGLLDRLASAHLLDRPAHGRYARHDLLRLYAAERAAEEEPNTERDAAARRLHDWYLHSATAAVRLLFPQLVRLHLPVERGQPPGREFDSQAQAMAWLDAERLNLLATVRHTAEHGPRQVAWRLADALRGYFWLRANPVDWLATARAALAAAEADGDAPGQAAAHLSLADAQLRQNQHSSAIEHYRQALVLTRRTGWLDGQASVLSNLGMAHWRAGRPHEAAEHYTRALAIDRQTGRRAGHASRRNNLGVVCVELGLLEQAVEHQQRALELHREAGSSRGEAVTLGNLGTTYHTLGQFDRAIDHFDRAVALHRAAGDKGAETEALRGLAGVHRDAGRHAQALDLARAALVLAGQVGDRWFEADTLNTLGTAHQALGQHADAAEHHGRALRLARRTETRYGQTAALVGLAVANRSLGRLGEARASADQALTLVRRAGYRLLEGYAHAALAEISLAERADSGVAAEHARLALAIHSETGHRLGEVRALLLLGEVLHRRGDATAAEEHWRQALDLATELGAPEASAARALLHPQPACLQGPPPH